MRKLYNYLFIVPEIWIVGLIVFIVFAGEPLFAKLLENEITLFLLKAFPFVCFAIAFILMGIEVIRWVASKKKEARRGNKVRK